MSDLIRLPALIDPHVHFRTPGATHKEDWISGAQAAIAGGVTTVFDMPNTNPVTTTYERLMDKKALIDAQLVDAGIPLHYRLFFGADKKHFGELSKLIPQSLEKDFPIQRRSLSRFATAPLLREPISIAPFNKGGAPNGAGESSLNIIAGIKVFMGSSTGDLLMDDEASLDQLFKICAELNLLVAVHAENEALIRERTPLYQTEDFGCHSVIRSPEVAAKALEQAIALTRKYGTKLYALHIGSRLELELLHQAKTEGLPVWIEIAPHYLFLNTTRYADLQGKAQMNPPLRSPEDQAFLWEAIALGWVDTIGSDHAPHPRHDKEAPYCKCPSGVPGVQTTLPLLLNAYNEGKITLEKIVELTHTNPKKIFNLPDNDDYVMVDLNLEKTVTQEILYSKAGWSPYEGMTLKGWPVYTVLGGQRYDAYPD